VPPLVSICIPTHNGARWIERSLRSAMSQTYQPVEILIVDDASTDDTAKIATSFHDPRIRVEVNKSKLGLVRNWNRCITLSKGTLVKFLFQDDMLYPTCVEKMVLILEKYPRIGIVFSPRDILLENPHDPTAIDWEKQYGTLHTRFNSLSEVNQGIDLFNQWLRCGFAENWVGEPSCVMVRKECVERIGMFNTRMIQIADIEMWVRLMYFYDLGFIEEPLSAFTFHPSSTTSLNIARKYPHLDRLWLMQGLLCYREIRRTHPEIRWLKFLEIARALKLQLVAHHRRKQRATPLLPVRPQALADYLGYLLLDFFHAAPSIH